MCNKIISVAKAVDIIPDGVTIMYGGSLGCDSTHHVTEALAQKDTRDLTIIGDDYGMATGPNGEGFYGVAELVHNHRVEHVIATYVGMTPNVGTQGMVDKTLTMGLIPQGTLAEIIRAGGIGLGGVLAPTSVSTIVKDSPFYLDKQTIDGRDHPFMKPIHADSALINDYLVNRFDNVWHKNMTRNFNIVMVTTADAVIAETGNVVEIGNIQPENVIISGAFINYIVDGGNA